MMTLNKPEEVCNELPDWGGDSDAERSTDRILETSMNLKILKTEQIGVTSNPVGGPGSCCIR